ncbi:MAG TPA: hypothetical protein VMH39_07290 [Gemmatimonadaceae bacterium]|nr:hypothetical protein [Gemmatimonadaceae bacterium]
MPVAQEKTQIHPTTLDLTPPERASALREPERLMDSIDASLPRRNEDKTDRSDPVVGRRVYRVPGRCIIQAEEQAVSVSWFPSRDGDPRGGELQVVIWDGIIASPRQRPGAGKHASITQTFVFRLTHDRNRGWYWSSEDHPARCPSSDLAKVVHGLLPEAGIE